MCTSFRSRQLFPIIDNAYQGFVKDLVSDAYAARLFADAGVEMMVACSCSKNFGLYNQRIGCLHTLCYSREIATNVLSQLTGLSRTLVSNCPAHGGRIVQTILEDEELKAMWVRECQEMADRLSAIRILLHECLTKCGGSGAPGNWDHILTQKGMFTFSGLSPSAVEKLQREYRIYMLSNGRISLAGLNTHNVEYFAQSVSAVLRGEGN
jgi:aspartate aminotransferase, cytoplasmic